MFDNAPYEKIPAARRIHPAVFEATAEELIEAGWGEVERANIPSDWKTRRPSPDKRGPWDWFLQPDGSSEQ